VILRGQATPSTLAKGLISALIKQVWSNYDYLICPKLHLRSLTDIEINKTNTFINNNNPKSVW